MAWVAALLFAVLLPYYGQASGYPDPEELLLLQRAYATMRDTGTISQRAYEDITGTPVIVVRRVWEPLEDLSNRTWLQHNAGRSCTPPASYPSIGCTHGLYRHGVIYILQLDWHLALNANVPPCQFNGRWFLSLAIHEAHHAAGYRHGQAMSDADRRALDATLNRADVRHIQRVYDTLRHEGRC